MRPLTDDDDMTKLLVLQGPNMSFLGRRQPELYGTTTAAELDQMLYEHARNNAYDLEIFYTHIEGEAIARLYQAVDEGIEGLVMNPAGFLYSGYALRDCLRTISFPYIEVHMTNIEKRGIQSILAEASIGMVAGLGLHSYFLGLDAMLSHLRSK
jgi:3-dehydroquinate dehydratase-2